MVGRRYHEERDLEAVTRIWREVGWIDDDSDAHAKALRSFMSAGATLVADIDGVAECAVHRSPGIMRVGETDLALSAITAVTTSHVARKQRFASAMMAEALAEAHSDGVAMAALGIFEQGFYDRFGFGTGGYEHRLRFDPSTLSVDVPSRPPVRVGVDDARELYDLLWRRHRSHGAVCLEPPQLVTLELALIEHPFGLGFRDDDGRLTHAVLGARLDEYGPYRVDWMVYERPPQVLELLGLLKGLGDQVATVEVPEPPELQLQDLIREPMRQRRAAAQAGRHGPVHGAHAWRQWRIMDLHAVVAATPTSGASVTFGLRLTDPLADRGGPWPGLGGEFTLHLSDTPDVAEGIRPDVHVLEASVGALTRLVLGVRSASSLALTDDFSAPAPLRDALDRAIRLPPLAPGWDF